MLALKQRRNQTLQARGQLVESTTIGAMVIIRTTVQMYIVHMAQIPVIDPVTARKLRDLYVAGLSTYELARETGIDVNSIQECVAARGQWRHLPSVIRKRLPAAESARTA